jgi:5-methylcytosine-specific restriction enzyme A
MTGFLKPCTHPGCTRVQQGPRCELHPHQERQRNRAKEDDRRGSAASRGYDARWRKVRALHMAFEPLCRWCVKEGRTTSGELVDHIVPLRLGGDRLSRSNLQTLCRRCHAIKTAAETAPGGRRRAEEGTR